MDNLHIPKGIRFQCSGCGNCCLKWPVPLTQQDVDRLGYLFDDVAAAAAAPTHLERQLRAVLGKPSGPGYRSLDPGDLRFRGFSHTLEKREDGKCRFLTDDNRCAVQQQHGEEAKPAMCRLFPHAFAQTPAGVFAYLSFASSAVLYNQGLLLSDQRDLLIEKYQLYRHLFPGVSADWSNMQILDGHPLTWDEFESIDRDLIELFESPGANQPRGLPVLDKLIQASRLVVNRLPKSANPEKLPPLPVASHEVDNIILKHFYAAYLPDDVFNESSFDIDGYALMSDIASAPHAVSIGGLQPEAFRSLSLRGLDPACDDLLRRFVYSRIFAKLYFGPSLGHFSLLAGIHHLFFVVAVCCLHLKRLKSQDKTVDLTAIAETVRTIERRLSQMNFSARTSAVMEVLMSSPARLVRVYTLLV